jgi:nucleoside-diphosphate-sugar epimerase
MGWCAVETSIAVTGYTGFIGSNLVDRLVRKGHTVRTIGRDFKVVDCSIVYHLACPSSTQEINSNPIGVMDTIIDLTRQVVQGYSNTLIVNASSIGASFIPVDNSAQEAYNISKLCMEMYLLHSKVRYMNYRLPSVYGPGMSDDAFIKRCIDNTAYYPEEPNKMHYIAHIDEVVDALIDLRPVELEAITLGQIYELFNSGRRGLHRPALDSGSF